MEELLAEQDSDIKSFKHGDVVEGTVVRIDKDEILVDIGAKSEGVVSNRELYGRHAESQPQLSIGDVVLVYVLQPESPEGHVVLSLRRAGLERKWRAMQELFEAGTIIDAPVIDHNKGGLIVDCGIRGFVPISQIVDFPRRPQNEQPRDAAQEIAEKLQPYIGRKLRLKILEVNRKANRLILSEKVALYEERREKRDELFSSLQVGQKVTGNVRSIAPFGIFIDLGGIDGLVHKSELSWNKVNNPEAGYKVGDEVEAEVIDINHERGRISLSIRRLQPDPWESTVADFKVGDVIDGTVTKLVNFGAFVRVREGLEGLIHISELSHQRVAHPGDVVHEGQVLKLKIISLDSERHRLGLSLKQAEEAPVRPMPEPGTMQAPVVGERRERRERRERPDRGYAPTGRAQRAGGRDRHDPRRRVRPGPQPAGRGRGGRGARAAGRRSREASRRRGRRRGAEPEPRRPPRPSPSPSPRQPAEAVAEPERRGSPRGRRRARAEAAREAVAEPEPEAAAEAVAEPEPEAAPEAVAEPEPEAAARGRRRARARGRAARGRRRARARGRRRGRRRARARGSRRGRRRARARGRQGLTRREPRSRDRLTTRRSPRRVVSIPSSEPPPGDASRCRRGDEQWRRRGSPPRSSGARSGECPPGTQVLGWPSGRLRDQGDTRPDGSLRQVHGSRAQGPDAGSGRGAAVQPQLHRHRASAAGTRPRGRGGRRAGAREHERRAARRSGPRSSSSSGEGIARSSARWGSRRAPSA